MVEWIIMKRFTTREKGPYVFIVTMILWAETARRHDLWFKTAAGRAMTGGYFRDIGDFKTMKM